MCEPRQADRTETRGRSPQGFRADCRVGSNSPGEADRAHGLSAMTASSTATRSLHDLSYSALERELVASGISSVHARALWRALHRAAEASAWDQAGFSPPLQRWVAENVHDVDSEAPGGFFSEAPAVVADTA